MRFRRAVLLVAAALAATSVVHPGDRAYAAPPTPNFGPVIDDYADYVGYQSCENSPKPGAVAFKDLVLAAYPGTTNVGIPRPCSDPRRSEHKEGRAWDWGTNTDGNASVISTAERARVDDLLNWLFATDRHGNRHAMARRTGVMYLIWDAKIYSAYTNPPFAARAYGKDCGSNATCLHKDHVHFSFSWDGARKRTSYWTGLSTGNPPATATPQPVPYWHPTESLGGAPLGGRPVAESWGPGHIDVFWRGMDNGLWHKYYTSGTGWTIPHETLHAPSSLLGSGITSDPAPVSWGAGHLDVYVKGFDNALWHRWYTNGWSGWESLGTPLPGVPLASKPVSVSWGAGHVSVFARGIDGLLWHKQYRNGWRDWESLGMPVGVPCAIVDDECDLEAMLSDPTVVSFGANHLDVFARGPDGALWHRWYDGTTWYGWESLGGAVLGSDPHAVSWGNGHIDVFWRGIDDNLWHRWYTSGTGWNTPLESLGAGPLGGDPRPVSWGSGHIDVFWRGTNNAMWHKFYVNSQWYGPESLGGTTDTDPSGVSFGSGHLDVFMRGGSQELSHRWYG